MNIQNRIAVWSGAAALVAVSLVMATASPAAADNADCKIVLDDAGQLNLTSGAICDTTFALASLLGPPFAFGQCVTLMSTLGISPQVADAACTAAIEPTD